MTDHMTPIQHNATAIIAEAQKAAWLYDHIKDACPYPFGSLAAEIFISAFNRAREDIAHYNAAPAAKANGAGGAQ